MKNLMERILKSGNSKNTSLLSESDFFGEKNFVSTGIPIIDIAFSGSVNGGLLPGLTVVAGASKTFKTMLSLYCMKAYLEKHDDGVAILYDSEFGITPEYIKSFGIDTNRVVHIPIENVEKLKFDLVGKLTEIEKGDNVFIMIDSVGNLASKKEVEDAENEKSVADMSRAKSIKSLFRIVTPLLTMKDIPCMAINHVYQELGLYPKAIVSGGTGIMYSANQVFIIGKAQEKDAGELAGYKFTINIEKSRYVREKAKLPFTVLYESGIQKWSGMFDLALASGYIVKATQGWYNTIDLETGEVIEPKRRAKDIDTDEDFYENLLKNKEFRVFVEHKYKLSMNGEETEETDSE